MSRTLEPGSIVWLDVADAVGHEQSGRRPWVVVSSRTFLDSVPSLATVVPCTTSYRPWEHRVELRGATGLSRPTYAMCEQVRTLSRDRIVSQAGRVDDTCLGAVALWVHAWLQPAA